MIDTIKTPRVCDDGETVHITGNRADGALLVINEYSDCGALPECGYCGRRLSIAIEGVKIGGERMNVERCEEHGDFLYQESRP